MPSVTHADLESKGRLLFVLLESVHDSGLNLDSELEQQWFKLRREVVATDAYESNAAESYELLNQISSTGALRDTWIERRYQDVQRQLQA